MSKWPEVKPCPRPRGHAAFLLLGILHPHRGPVHLQPGAGQCPDLLQSAQIFCKKIWGPGDGHQHQMGWKASPSPPEMGWWDAPSPSHHPHGPLPSLWAHNR